MPGNGREVQIAGRPQPGAGAGVSPLPGSVPQHGTVQPGVGVSPGGGGGGAAGGGVDRVGQEASGLAGKPVVGCERWGRGVMRAPEVFSPFFPPSIPSPSSTICLFSVSKGPFVLFVHSCCF